MGRRRTNKKVVKSIQRNNIKEAVYKERVQKKSFHHTAEECPILINPEDTKQNPLTWDRLMNWLADTGWVYGYVRKRISPMDAHLYEDYAQHCWLSILEVKPERMMEIWYTGKGAFINYIKRIIDIQIKSMTTSTYIVNKKFHNTHVTIPHVEWEKLEEGCRVANWVDAFPVRYNCPSGNRKKMIQIEYEELPFEVDPGYSLIETHPYYE